MAEMSRKCVPFTPYDRELSRATVALVTAGGVHRKDQPPFNIADDLGDLTYRVINGDVKAEELMVTHDHYDHSDADQDINVVFPIDLLRDLVQEGFIAEVAPIHIGYMGYTMQLKRMYEETVPQIAEEIDKRSRADIVVVTGGCPQVCHRTVTVVQREIEMRGLSTVAITVGPEATRQMRPPRALYPRDFKIGNALGRAGMRELQKRVLRDALMLLKESPRPGEVIEREYPEYFTNERSSTA
ncbi:MAG: glycine/sarcosine/betaine reductase selenoprotein B family protein [Acidobacteriota bacterium]